MSAGTTTVNQLLNAPLPLIIERLGISVAEAQSALDKNSIAIAQSMIETEVNIGGTNYNLLTLGFTPTFYAFTDAMVEAKLEFTVKESKEFGVGGEVSVSYGVVGATVSAHYARKYEMEAKGTSSISARMVSVPAPERLTQLLEEISEADNTNSNIASTL